MNAFSLPSNPKIHNRRLFLNSRYWSELLRMPTAERTRDETRRVSPFSPEEPLGPSYLTATAIGASQLFCRCWSSCWVVSATGQTFELA